MNDIVDIYEPIYREGNNILLLLIVALGLIIIGFSLFFIIKYFVKKSKIVTPEMHYNNCLNNFIKLQGNIGNISSHDFSLEVNTIFKSYLTRLYDISYLPNTAGEIIEKLKSEELETNLDLEDIFVKNLEMAQYGKKELEASQMHILAKECVDIITTIYNKKDSSNE